MNEPFRFRPLAWDGPVTPAHERRSRWTFKAPWSDTLALLRQELSHLDATGRILEADFRERDLRLDGMPRADARQPAHPGIRLFFDSKYGPLVYATDKHEFWQHNVRAIALGLESLRAVDRYGVTRRGEQYKGWNALPSGIEVPSSPLTVDEAARFVAEHGAPSLISMGGWLLLKERSHASELRRAYQAAARKLHPDTGGREKDFKRLQDAMRLLGGDR